jgi:hypothetical protein
VNDHDLSLPSNAKLTTEGLLQFPISGSPRQHQPRGSSRSYTVCIFRPSCGDFPAQAQSPAAIGAAFAAKHVAVNGQGSLVPIKRRAAHRRAPAIPDLRIAATASASRLKPLLHGLHPPAPLRRNPGTGTAPGNCRSGVRRETRGGEWPLFLGPHKTQSRPPQGTSDSNPLVAIPPPVSRRTPLLHPAPTPTRCAR